MDCLLFTCRLISTTEFDQFAGCLIDCLYLDHKRNFLCLIMQMPFLEEWAVLDRDHSSSLLGATEALRASTLRLPVVEKAIVCSTSVIFLISWMLKQALYKVKM